MKSFFIRRITLNLLTFVIMSYLIFQLMVLMPGDPLDILVSTSPGISPEDIAKLKEIYGLNKPGWERYLNWATEVLQGNLGYSRTYGVPVTQIISSPILNTFILASLAMALSLFVAIPLGVFAAVKEGKWQDNLLRFLSFSWLSIPSFWMGIILILLFSVVFKLLPAGGVQTIGVESEGLIQLILDRISYLILPSLSLSFGLIGIYLRYTRNSVVEVLKQDYVRTARSKGLSQKRILFVHVLRNGIIPIVTVVSISFGTLFSGALITETVFAYPGLGRLIYDSIISNDFNVAMIALMLVVALVLASNLMADLLYSVLNPRVELE